jgi:hypothetical protein
MIFLQARLFRPRFIFEVAKSLSLAITTSSTHLNLNYSNSCQKKVSKLV